MTSGQRPCLDRNVEDQPAPPKSVTAPSREAPVDRSVSISENVASVITEASSDGAACGWQPCSGCHESNEGHPTGPYSKMLFTYVGFGCHECGGLGAVWEHWSAKDLNEMARDDHAPPAVPLVFTYRNWRGETAERRAVPVRVHFGATEWHPGPQWLLTALDIEKQAERDFAIADISFGPPGFGDTAAERSKAAADVLAERRRQSFEEGWSPEHDDQHDDGQLALAAACYALPDWQRSEIKTLTGAGEVDLVRRLWPWNAFWKPKDIRSDLVRAGALILAEIERLDRMDRACLDPAGEDGQ